MKKKTIHLTYADANRLAQSTEDAYSFDRYASWPALAVMLSRCGYSYAEAECILRSKWTRWAADASTTRYGYATSKDLARFIDGMKDSRADLARMMRS